jgi:predicted nucleic acid-binding Zn ribbon protein
MAPHRFSDEELYGAPKGAPATRTTASAGQSCRRCGGPIGGRRRNGFCSDRCRMRVKREEEAKRRGEVLDRLREAVAEVEGEWAERRSQ